MKRTDTQPAGLTGFSIITCSLTWVCIRDIVKSEWCWTNDFKEFLTNSKFHHVSNKI